MQYRPEIDGLRAIAVLPVMLFHAGFSAFSGGYVGVDIFFVISGYLITSILIGELSEGRFSLIGFYERRARRILPALFLVMLVCIPFVLALYMPPDVKDFFESLGAVSIFASNMLFWIESGYFNAASELKPLLHTWSLAVEEQYYILFPLFLMATWFLGKRWIVAMLIVGGAISLGVAHWAVYTKPVATFYLLPTRGWEILIGALAAFYLYKRQDSHAQKTMICEIGSIIGLALIAVSVFIFDKQTPFPSLYALVPTVGTVLIIICAKQGTLIGKILSQKIFVGIGLVSYSAYLWHQPIFAFTKYKSVVEPSALIMLILCLVTFALAYLSWRYVEKPFRNKENFSRSKIFAFSGLFIVFFMVISIWGHKTNGFKEAIVEHRLTAEQQDTYKVVREAIDYDLYENMVDDGECHFWTRSVDEGFEKRFTACTEKHGKALIVLGDSHAMNVYNIFAKADISPFVVSVSQGNCRPHDNHKFCHYDGFIDFTERNRGYIQSIVYHQSGGYLVQDVHGQIDAQNAFHGKGYEFSDKNIIAIREYIKKLESAAGQGIIWLGPFIEYRYRPFDVVYDAKYMNVNPHSIKIFNELSGVLEDVTREDALSFINFDQLYDVPSTAMQGGCFIFKDYDHFSLCGEDLVAETLKENKAFIKTILAN